MAGRPKAFEPQNALEKALQLFWKQGYEATSLRDLMVAMKIKKGSFYNTFGSKKQLFVDAVKLHDTKSFKEFRKLLTTAEDPMEVIKSLFLSFADGSTKEHYKGCFAGNILTELTVNDKKLSNGAKVYLLTLESIFAEQIAIAQSKGKMKNKTSPELLARYLLNLWNGINITRRMYPSKDVLRPLVEFQLNILK